MEMLKFKLPLRISVEVEDAFGNGYKDILLSELDPDKIQIDELYNCEYNWITDDGEVNKHDKLSQGFDGSEVIMEVTFKDYNYYLDIITSKPLDSSVTFYKYGSYCEEDKVTMTLKEAILFALEGQLSDGIGENEIGYIRYEGELYDVWFGDLMEL